MPARRGIKHEILNFLFVKRSAPFYARYTLHHHLLAGILEGVCYGIIGLNAYVAKRSLSATTNEIAALASLPMVVFLFSSVWAQFMTDRNNSRFILLSGVLGRLSLFAFFFIESSMMLVGMIVLYNFMHSIFMLLIDMQTTVSSRPSTGSQRPKQVRKRSQDANGTLHPSLAPTDRVWLVTAPHDDSR